MFSSPPYSRGFRPSRPRFRALCQSSLAHAGPHGGGGGFHGGGCLFPWRRILGVSRRPRSCGCATPLRSISKTASPDRRARKKLRNYAKEIEKCLKHYPEDVSVGRADIP